MPFQFFSRMFRGLRAGVLVCQDYAPYSLIYGNDHSTALLNSPHNSDKISELSLSALLSCSDEYLDELVALFSAAQTPARQILKLEGDRKDIKHLSLSGHAFHYQGKRYLILFLRQLHNQPEMQSSYLTTMNQLFRISYFSDSAAEAISSVLNICGSCLGMNRGYIIEPQSSGRCSATYEWYAAGGVPRIDSLQQLRRQDACYDTILGSRDVLLYDTAYLDKSKHPELLEDDVRYIVLVPLIYQGRGMGYAGFTDSRPGHFWSYDSIDLLKNTGMILASLLYRRESENHNSRLQNIIHTVLDNIGNPVMINSIDSYEILYINDAMLRSISSDPNLEPRAVIGMKCYELLAMSGRPACPECPLQENRAETEHLLAESSFREYYSIPTDQWFAVQDTLIEWTNGELVHLESSLEITPQKRNEEMFRKLASTDEMTGAYSRKWGYHLMTNMLNHKKTGSDCSLIFVDIDGLKAVNDTYGHSSGDEMIVTMVNLIRSNIRKEDIIIRWGGDEFILLLQTPPGRAREIMKKIMTRIEEFNHRSTRPYTLSFSYGIVRFAAAEQSGLDDLISAADKLMYEAKLQHKSSRDDSP